MKIIKNNIGVETLIFASTFEYDAYEQVKKLANFKAYQNAKIRIMPDAHLGKGCTIGTTMTISDKITPNLVGVDIGCGMEVVKILTATDIDLEKLDKIINHNIPAGHNVHTKTRASFDFDKLRCQKHVDLKRASLSLGSLGGGNHFIEVGKSEKTGDIYLVIHSGSRKLGGDVCKYYQNKAFQNVNEISKVKEQLIKKLKLEGKEREINSALKQIQKPTADKDLAYLEGDDFADYMFDMQIVQSFASLNRITMAKIILEEMGLLLNYRFETIHNYIDFSRMMLRKGAVSSENGELLLIPINMRDGSLLCVGKGNEEWNYSAPHGAGRILSRTKAKEVISMKEFTDSMEGIYTTSVNSSTLDEAPQAYKPIEEIKSLIVDTVEIIDTIKPVYNFKAN